MQKRIIAVLVGHSNDPLWSVVADDAAALMEEVRKLGLESDAFDEKYITHRRGDFIAIPVGVSYGGGSTIFSSLFLHLVSYTHSLVNSKKPGNLVHTKARQQLIQKLLDSPSIQRITGFQSSKLHLHCRCSFLMASQVLLQLLHQSSTGMYQKCSQSLSTTRLALFTTSATVYSLP